MTRWTYFVPLTLAVVYVASMIYVVYVFHIARSDTGTRRNRDAAFARTHRVEVDR